MNKTRIYNSDELQRDVDGVWIPCPNPECEFDVTLSQGECHICRAPIEYTVTVNTTESRGEAE